MVNNIPTDIIPNATTSKGTKKPRGEVFIYTQWCKSCQICVEFCPTQVLVFDEDRHIPIVAAPENCTGCHFCDTHCPDLAIFVRRL
jgi:2-oxoglutarate ferredoxin oxidoreductase subunit delta